MAKGARKALVLLLSDWRSSSSSSSSGVNVAERGWCDGMSRAAVGAKA